MSEIRQKDDSDEPVADWVVRYTENPSKGMPISLELKGMAVQSMSVEQAKGIIDDLSIAVQAVELARKRQERSVRRICRTDGEGQISPDVLTAPEDGVIMDYPVERCNDYPMPSCPRCGRHPPFRCTLKTGGVMVLACYGCGHRTESPIDDVLEDFYRPMERRKPLNNPY